MEKFEREIRPHVGDRRQFIASAPDPSLWPDIQVFHLNQVQYWAGISQEALLSGPDWTPSKPLPIDFGKVETIARKELRKLISDDSTWQVTSFHLRSVPVATPGANDVQLVVSRKWYFQVEMRPVSQYQPEVFADPLSHGQPERAAGQHSDSFCVFIDLSGQPGKIKMNEGR